jgi:SAM-dependent methyltransferase
MAAALGPGLPLTLSRISGPHDKDGVVTAPKSGLHDPVDSSRVEPVPTRREMARRFRRALADRDRAVDRFAFGLAQRTVASFPLPLEGARVLDLGCGPGWYAPLLAEAGADVVAADHDPAMVARAAAHAPQAVVADARRTPFENASFDGVLCSNLLEHTPEPEAVIAEIERVLRPGGWAYVSWTNWLSPWGGHDIAPLHFLGPRWGLRVYRRLFGEPRGGNLPYAGVWPVSISAILQFVRERPGLTLERAVPRYYPSQSWILLVPGLREVLTWNCLLLLRRTDGVEPQRSAATAAVSQRGQPR